MQHTDVLALSFFGLLIAPLRARCVAAAALAGGGFPVLFEVPAAINFDHSLSISQT